jgi:hypothetical protein
VTWYSTPNFRGTWEWDLVISYVLTLTIYLCMYGRRSTSMYPLRVRHCGSGIFSTPAEIGLTDSYLSLFARYVVAPLFVVTRAYLVVEGFVSLRRVLKEIYQTPQWSIYLPHL